MSNSVFNLPVAIESFSQFWSLSHAELSQMRATLAKLPRYSKRLAWEIGYTEKLNQIESSISLNAALTHSISKFGRVLLEAEEIEVPSGISGWARRLFDIIWKAAHYPPPATDSSCSKLNQVRDTLRHCVRDWSDESKEERERSIQPILDVFRLESCTVKGKKVFVPGCGLGRLAWEISELGYDTTALDFSPYVTLSLRFLLSPQMTTTINQHKLQPYAYDLPHQSSNTHLYRLVRFPDVVPREKSGKFKFVQGDFLRHDPFIGVGKERGGYDYIVTLFFVDTAADVFNYILRIHHLLAPGGLWVNLGPLLWTSGCLTCPALSLEEVIEVTRRSGFKILGEEADKEPARREMTSRRIDCGYTTDKHAMMTYEYHAQFWVARKERG